MKQFIFFVILLLMAAPALAQVTVTETDAFTPVYTWDGINDETSADSQKIDRGCYQFTVEGTTFDAEFEIQFKDATGEAFVDVDSDAAENGLLFTSASERMAIATFGSGDIDIKFNSAGSATSDVNLIVRKISNEPC